MNPSSLKSVLQALTEILKEEKIPLSGFLKEFNVLREALDSDTVKAFFMSPLVALEVKKKVLGQALTPVVRPLILKLFYVLLEKKLFSQWDRLCYELKAQDQKNRRVLKVRVQTAHPLPDSLKEPLKQALAGFFKGREVLLHEELCPGLLGGLRVQKGDQVLDHSVLNHLNRMEDKIRSGLYGNAGQ